MGTRLVFPSWGHADTKAYSWYSTGYDAPFHAMNHRVVPLSERAGYFLTYGDSTVQHSGESVVPVDGWLDYLASLGKHLKDNQGDAATIEGGWPHFNNLNKIRFAAAISFNPDKRRFYSVGEEKVSASESKRHDKRWEQVPDWADMTLLSTYRLLSQSFYDSLDRYALADQIADYFNKESCRYTGADVLDVCGVVRKEHDKFGRDTHLYSSSFRAVDHYVQAHRQLDHGKGTVECLENNYGINYLGKRREQAETEAATVMS